MPFVYNIPFFCIFLCMITAILLSAVKNARVSWCAALFVSSATAVMSAVLLAYIARSGETVSFTMGKFAAPLGNEIRFGPLQALLCMCFSSVMALSMLGGKRDMFHDVDEKKMGLACVMLCMVLASLLALTYTNDVFTAYVFIEVSTISACALVVVKDSAATLVASIRYLFMSLMGSGLFLFGIAILYALTGHLLMPQLSAALAGLMASGDYRLPMAVAAAMITVGLGIKSAMFPFYRWLPDAHGSATTSSSAVLSGLVLKGYAVLLITMFTRVFSLEAVRELGLDAPVLLLGFLGMIIGSLYALREYHSKRLLAYSSVAQLGYVFMGIGLCTQEGLAAACFQIIVHAVTKPLLFVSVGRLSCTVGHEKQLSALRGSAWSVPLAGIGFTVGALSMVGVPLLAGFTAKLGLASASVGGGVQAALSLLVLALSSVLNAMYYVPALINIWKSPQQTCRMEKDSSFTVAAVLLIAWVLALGTFFWPVTELIEHGLELM